jgi:hypothetical protein
MANHAGSPMIILPRRTLLLALGWCLAAVLTGHPVALSLPPHRTTWVKLTDADGERVAYLDLSSEGAMACAVFSLAVVIPSSDPIPTSTVRAEVIRGVEVWVMCEKARRASGWQQIAWLSRDDRVYGRATPRGDLAASSIVVPYLPTWRELGDDESRDWELFIADVLRHEAGHLAMAIVDPALQRNSDAAAVRAYDACMTIPSSPEDCGSPSFEMTPTWLNREFLVTEPLDQIITSVRPPAATLDNGQPTYMRETQAYLRAEWRKKKAMMEGGNPP